MVQPSRGFLGAHRKDTGGYGRRLPPGQHDTGGTFPVLSAGATPRTDLTRWDFSVQGQVDQPARWSWREFQALPR